MMGELQECTFHVPSLIVPPGDQQDFYAGLLSTLPVSSATTLDGFLLDFVSGEPSVPGKGAALQQIEKCKAENGMATPMFSPPVSFLKQLEAMPDSPTKVHQEHLLKDLELDYYSNQKRMETTNIRGIVETKKNEKSASQYDSFEYGMLASSFAAHVQQLIIAQRSWEDSLPIKQVSESKLGNVMDFMERMNPAASLIQTAWRRFASKKESQRHRSRSRSLAVSETGMEKILACNESEPLIPPPFPSAPPLPDHLTEKVGHNRKSTSGILSSTLGSEAQNSGLGEYENLRGCATPCGESQSHLFSCFQRQLTRLPPSRPLTAHISDSGTVLPGPLTTPHTDEDLILEPSVPAKRSVDPLPPKPLFHVGPRYLQYRSAQMPEPSSTISSAWPATVTQASLKSIASVDRRHGVWIPEPGELRMVQAIDEATAAAGMNVSMHQLSLFSEMNKQVSSGSSAVFKTNGGVASGGVAPWIAVGKNRTPGKPVLGALQSPQQTKKQRPPGGGSRVLQLSNVSDPALGVYCSKALLPGGAVHIALASPSSPLPKRLSSPLQTQSSSATSTGARPDTATSKHPIQGSGLKAAMYLQQDRLLGSPVDSPTHRSVNTSPTRQSSPSIGTRQGTFVELESVQERRGSFNRLPRDRLTFQRFSQPPLRPMTPGLSPWSSQNSRIPMASPSLARAAYEERLVQAGEEHSAP